MPATKKKASDQKDDKKQSGDAGSDQKSSKPSSGAASKSTKKSGTKGH